MAGPDRLDALVAQNVVTGVDFVYVHPDQITLDVFFLTPPLALAAPLSSLTLAQLRIHADGMPDVPVVASAWTTSESRDVLRITTATPGGFLDYRFRIDDVRIDPFWNDVTFSFKANCPSTIDCAPLPHECPPDDVVDVPIDTTARDFWSFRRALFEFANQRYPEWKDRLEADVGVMFAEVLSALGDEMAFYQDRVGREATLETASQRRSLRRLARLVDYEIHDGRGATSWLDVQVSASAPGTQLIGAGSDVWSRTDAGEIIPFEVGHGLDDVLAGTLYDVDTSLNALAPHIWDQSVTCLPVGSTSLHVEGHVAAALMLDDTPDGVAAGRYVVLWTDPADPSVPARRWVVRVISVVEETDPLAAALGTDPDITRITWESDRATPFELDLETLTVHGNIVPITAGRTLQRQFSIGIPGTPVPPIDPAVERSGPNGTTAYLYTLPDGEGDGLVRLGAKLRAAKPEIRVATATWTGTTWTEHAAWNWRRALLGVDSAERDDEDFTLDDGTWARMVGYRRLGGEIVHRDYLTGEGTTVRFGDGEFGMIPADGTVFQVTYRLGNGARSNLPAGAVSHVGILADDGTSTPDPSLFFIDSVSNPVPTIGGVEPEPVADIRKLAPEAFRAITLRAVRPEDYAEQAMRLPWVQRAGATFRWTGSWLSAFVTADPRDAETLSLERRRELVNVLDRVRQTGREVYALGPRYADLDLKILFCVDTHAYAGEVVPVVLEALFGKHGVRPRRGFFDPDHFTFGTSLDRSQLEALIQSLPGVRAVEYILFRRRGYFDWRLMSELQYHPGADSVIRVANDRTHPERGSVQLFPQGGA